MSNEYMRKKFRLKRQWSYIEAALKLVQLAEQSEKKRSLLEAITKSDSMRFDQLLNEDISILDGPIPPGYNYSNLYQIIIERSTENFIDQFFTQYNDRIVHSTDGGKILVPVACERGSTILTTSIECFRFVLGDAKVLELILKHYPRASLIGISQSNPTRQHRLHNESDPLTKRELEAYVNEIPLACVIRNDRSDLLSILFRFKSFTFDAFNASEKKQFFYLCLLAEHRQITMDKFGFKWWKNQCLSPCGSIECLRFLIESIRFNPLELFNDDQSSYLSPLTVILEPIYLYLLEFHHRLFTDRQVSIPVRLIRAFYELMEKQFSIFNYLISHCLFQATESDVIRFDECCYYIEEFFNQRHEYNSVRRWMNNLSNLMKNLENPTKQKCYTLKELCRWKIRDSLRMNRCLLVHAEKIFFHLSSSHVKYLKYLQ